MHYRVYEKTIRYERAFMMRNLTFLYISFAIFFCQKKVKKICKFIVWVFFKTAYMRREQKRGEYAFFSLWGFISCNNVNLLSRGPVSNGISYNRALSGIFPSSCGASWIKLILTEFLQSPVMIVMNVDELYVVIWKRPFCIAERPLLLCDIVFFVVRNRLSCYVEQPFL